MGRSTAIRKTSPRRVHRSEKVCKFQVKNAIDRTVVNSSKLPSTRQYTGSSWPGPPGFSRNGFKGIFFPRCTLEPASETKVSIVNNRDQSAKLLAQQTAKCPEYIGLAPGHFHGGSHFRVQSGLLHVLPYDPASRIYQTEFPVGAALYLDIVPIRLFIDIGDEGVGSVMLPVRVDCVV